MMTLITYPVSLDARTVNVYWRTGKQHGGKLTMALREPSDCAALIAELCAIRHLIIVKQVFNVLPTSGKGICLEVSAGAIKKLANRSSAKKEAQPYANFLNPRFEDIEFKVVRNKLDDFPFVDDPAYHEAVDIDPEYFTSPYEVIDTPAMGQVVVTSHAVEQYVKRCPSDTITKPWKSLVQRLMHNELKRIPLPEKVLKHKERKYGQNNDIEAWGHDHSLFTYLVSNQGGQRKVVTVFRRMPG